MHFVFLLHVDCCQNLRYIFKGVNIEHKTIEEYTKEYTDKLIIFKDKVYLNGNVITDKIDYSYLSKSVIPRVPVNANLSDEVTGKYYVERNLIDIMPGDVYWIEEGNGDSLEINKHVIG